jgi:hypothetical protein
VAKKGKKPGGSHRSRRVAKKGAKTRSSRAAGRSKSRKTRSKSASRGPRRSAARSKPRKAAGKRPIPALPAAAGAVPEGEGEWKQGEEYPEGLKAFADSEEAEELGREAQEELEYDLQDSDDEDLEENAPPGAEEEPEW